MNFFLIGTNHANQQINHLYGKSQDFSALLLQCCQTHSIELIAEEMSVESLILAETHSVAEHVAAQIGIFHLLCDPDTAERTRLGIPTESDIRKQLGLGTRRVGVVDQIDEVSRTYWPLREAEWLRRIELHSCTRCLFIAGSQHVASFSSALSNAGHSNVVLHPNWNSDS